MSGSRMWLRGVVAWVTTVANALPVVWGRGP